MTYWLPHATIVQRTVTCGSSMSTSTLSPRRTIFTMSYQYLSGCLNTGRRNIATLTPSPSLARPSKRLRKKFLFATPTKASDIVNMKRREKRTARRTTKREPSGTTPLRARGGRVSCILVDTDIVEWDSTYSKLGALLSRFVQILKEWLFKRNDFGQVPLCSRRLEGW